MKLFSFLLPVFLLVATTAEVAHARVFLKATAKQAVPLRVDRLNVKVQVLGGIAITTWEMQAKTESLGGGDYYGFEASHLCDFILQRPTGAKVTSFEARQGQHVLHGQVFEHPVALPKVGLPAAKTDPLLRSGLNGSNSFRVTLFRLGTWHDLVVRGTWVEVLPAAAGKTRVVVPLTAFKGASTRVPQVNVQVEVQGGAQRTPGNNFGLKAQHAGSLTRYQFSQKNYRILRDLTVDLSSGGARQDALLVAPDGKDAAGHFVFTTTTGQVGKTAQIELLSGAAPGGARLKPASRHGETLLYSGRYVGPGAAVRLGGIRAGAPFQKAPAPQTHAIAASLWANAEINRLGKLPENKARVVALSKEHNVASRYTSWLAPAEGDSRLFQKLIASAQLDQLVREYWVLVARRQENGARGKKLRGAVDRIARGNGLLPRDELYMRLGSAYGYLISLKYNNYGEYRRSSNPQRERQIQTLGDIMTRYVKELTSRPASRSIDWASPLYGGELYKLRELIMKEYREPHPRYPLLKEWELRFARLYGSTYRDPRLRLWRAHFGARDLEEQTTAAEAAGDQQRLKQLESDRRANARNAYFVNNIGDPPIYVTAPADARQVVAIMPDGKVKTLEYNALHKRWEGNYDVPTSTREGDYSIQIVIVEAGGSRRSYAMKFRVDTSAPTGSGVVLMAPQLAADQSRALRLEVEHGGDVARVTALLPWGERVTLQPSTTRSQHFFGLVQAPAAYAGRAVQVTYILVDRAHNLTTVQAESQLSAAP